VVQSAINEGKDEKMNQEEQEIEIDLREIAGLLLSRLWILILAGVLTGVLAGTLTKSFYVPTYTSTAKLYIVGSTGIDLSNLSSFQIGSQLTSDYIEFIKSRPLLEQVIDDLNLEMNYDQMLSLIQVQNPDNTRILRLSVTMEDRKLAKEIVNKVAEVGQKKIAEITKMEEPSIFEHGVNGILAESPHFLRNTALGFMAGMVIAAFVIILLHVMDDTIKTSEDLERYLGLNTLGTIPLAEEHSKSKKGRKKSKKGSSSTRKNDHSRR